MITPIKAMTISQIIARQDDLLVSADDIKEIAKNERAKVIDEVIKTLGNDYWNIAKIQQLKEQKSNNTDNTKSPCCYCKSDQASCCGCPEYFEWKRSKNELYSTD